MCSAADEEDSLVACNKVYTQLTNTIQSCKGKSNHRECLQEVYPLIDSTVGKIVKHHAKLVVIKHRLLALNADIKETLGIVPTGVNYSTDSSSSEEESSSDNEEADAS